MSPYGAADDLVRRQRLSVSLIHHRNADLRKLCDQVGGDDIVRTYFASGSGRAVEYSGVEPTYVTRGVFRCQPKIIRVVVYKIRGGELYGTVRRFSPHLSARIVETMCGT